MRPILLLALAAAPAAAQFRLLSLVGSAAVINGSRNGAASLPAAAASQPPVLIGPPSISVGRP
jgi:hypothetical protein